MAASGYQLLDADDNLLFDLRATRRLAEAVRRPRGSLIRDVREVMGVFLSSVGDYVTWWLIKEGVKPRVAVIDGKVERRQVGVKVPDGYAVYRCRNPAGFITREAWGAIKRAFREASSGRYVCVVVDGEEDLLGFPVSYFTPPGGAWVYGQPGAGAIVVWVDIGRREVVKKLLTLFEPVICSSTSS